MSCGCNAGSSYSGGGTCGTCGGNGCGHNNCCCKPYSVCQREVPDGCDALETTNTAQRLVVEDEDFCKKTIETNTGSLVSVDNDGNVGWHDGSSQEPILIPNLNSSTTGVEVMGLDSGGALKIVEPSAPDTILMTKDGSTGVYAPLTDLINGCGVTYVDCNTDEVKGLQGNEGQLVTFDSNHNPTVIDANDIAGAGAFIDMAGVRISYSAARALFVNFQSVVVLNDAGGGKVVRRSSGSILDFTTTGVGGLDQGSISGSTYYYIFVVYDDANDADGLIASLSPTNPLLPSGYDYKRLIGLARTTSGGNFSVNYYQNGDEVVFGGDADITVFSGAGSGTNGYNSGVITDYVSTLYAVSAKYRMDFIQASGAGEFVAYIASAADEDLPQSESVYGGGSLTTVITNTNVFTTFTALIPVAGSSYYNLFVSGLTSTDNVALRLTGFNLALS